MGVVFGDKRQPPYVEAKLDDRWLVYEKAASSEEDDVPRPLTEMEQILVDELVEARKPLSKTQFREACLVCGDAKQEKIDTLTRELSQTRSQLVSTTVQLERLKQLTEGGDDNQGCKCGGDCGGK